MQKKRRIYWLQVLVAIATTFVLFAIFYFGAYLILGTRSINATIEAHVYRHEWQARLFRPAADLESFIRQKKVDTAYIVE